eukprot:gene4211-5274_t
MIVAINQTRVLSIQQEKFAYGNWTKLFLNISSCDFYNFGAIPEVEFYKYPDPIPLIVKWGEKQNREGISQIVIQDFKDKAISFGLDDISFNAIMMDYFIRQSTPMRDYITNAKQSIFSSSQTPRCVSIHVRHGDKYHENSLFGLTEYHKELMEAVDQISPEINYVFLMTDDPNVIEQSKSLVLPNKLKYVYSNIERRTSTTHASASFSSNNRERYGYEIFSEIDIASDCEFFIGTMSSNIGRAIIEMGSIKPRPQNINFKYIVIDGKDFKYEI